MISIFDFASKGFVYLLLVLFCLGIFIVCREDDSKSDSDSNEDNK